MSALRTASATSRPSKLVTTLDLRDFDIAGHSMIAGKSPASWRPTGPTGPEGRIISGIPPYLLKTDQTPTGTASCYWAGTGRSVQPWLR